MNVPGFTARPSKIAASIAQNRHQRPALLES
jgi:hypothetical protein